MPWRRAKSPSGSKWARVRLLVLDRDHWACVTCGRSGRLEVDHRVSIEHGGEMYAMENLQALCRSCHVAKHGGIVHETPPEVLEWQRYLKDMW